jgi:hypothetical protein
VGLPNQFWVRLRDLFMWRFLAKGQAAGDLLRTLLSILPANTKGNGHPTHQHKEGLCSSKTRATRYAVQKIGMSDSCKSLRLPKPVEGRRRLPPILLFVLIISSSADGAIVVIHSADPEFSKFGLRGDVSSPEIGCCYMVSEYNYYAGYYRLGDWFSIGGFFFTQGQNLGDLYYAPLAIYAKQPRFWWNGGTSDVGFEHAGALADSLNYGMIDMEGDGYAESVAQFYLSSTGEVTWQAMARIVVNGNIYQHLSISDAQAAIASSNVSIVPEPTTFLTSLIVCCIGILYRRRARRATR